MKKHKIVAKPCVYVVLAKRWGCNERHSYIVGARTDLVEAQILKDEHEEYRGGKYSCDIVCCPLTKTNVGFHPAVVIEADRSQEEPMIAEYLCRDIRKCPHLKKAKKEGQKG